MSNKLPEHLTLASLTTGEEANILNLNVTPELKNRLTALGIQIGKPVKVVRRGALGGPIHVRVSTTEFVLRLAEAGLISVTRFTALTA